jgi:TRAP-type C4-dicarboxylate transport system permease small subunit
VVGRYVFNAPIPAGFELTEYLMGLLVFLALPLVSSRGDHVRISLLDGRLPPAVRAVRDKAVAFVAALVCLSVAWPVAALGVRMAAYHDGTQTLGIPLAPLAFFIAVSLVLSAVLLALRPFMKR